MRLAPTPLVFQGRIQFFKMLTIISFLMVLAGYYRIQILEQERYEALGKKHRIKKTPIKASRGLIYDRDGRLITQNMPTYDLVLLRDEMEEPWTTLRPRLSRFLGVGETALDTRYRERSTLLSHPVKLLENIGFEESIRIRRHRTRFPGLSIRTIEKRYYPYGTLFAHVLGYVREASREDLRADADLRMGDIIGKSGLELAYHDLLTGLDGERTIMIDNRGVYRSQEVTVDPSPGHDLILTLDFELQQLAFQALEGRGGSVIMMDVRTGEVLVYISSPAFDLNLFTRGISQKKWDSLRDSKGKLFLNRPIQGAYAPGSVFKLVTVLAALKHNKITLNTKYFCSGSFDYFNRTYHCHRAGGHGQMDLINAIQASCNVYFYQVAKDLDPRDLASMAEEMGFGQPTGFDLRGEKMGLVPTPEWKKERFGQIWFPGETLSLAIGQGYLQATPLQVAVLMGTIANDGQIPTPHLMLKHRDAGIEHTVPLQAKHLEGIPRDYYQVLKRAMWLTVNHADGTGARARVQDYDVCGKTGTAQLITFTKESDHKADEFTNAWFAGFAPRDEPRVAVVVLVEQAGSGGKAAAPIAKMLFEAYQQRLGFDPT